MVNKLIYKKILTAWGVEYGNSGKLFFYSLKFTHSTLDV